ncbi:4,5:9,10-diseco-3-hydroxy-5,9, 17-trioxoandrosta-1(10),2-diene-4-oate hydrolase [Anaerolineae bacterium]|nr:4,5:9,10-diseco-3-hydroxy-5,9, 17-trioxoandrosta-1(10),2-diene-4-oate hydrolase [Anaerolineae bacterium]
MESKFIATPSGKFHAMIAGVGDPAILIHGSSVEHNSWRTWERNIDALATVARVYSLDLIGYGESDKPEPRLDARAEANAIIELLDAEGIDRATLVGLSWGGGIAQIIATNAPTRVSKLVLVDSRYSPKPENLARLKSIACPTLIVWDEEDAVIPVAYAQALGDAIPNSRVRVFKHDERDSDADPNNRHWSQVSHSREWNRVVKEFLLA